MLWGGVVVPMGGSYSSMLMLHLDALLTLMTSGLYRPENKLYVKLE